LRPLALAGLPYGTRCWADELGLIAGKGDDLYLTEDGQAVAAAAAERQPEPYADVSFADLDAQTEQTRQRLRERAPEVLPASPSRRTHKQPVHLFARVRAVGHQLFGGHAEHAGH
jgi:hypothetical protein